MFFGNLNVSSEELSGPEKAVDISRTYVELYLSRSEFAKKLDATLTEVQKDFFTQISHQTYLCFFSNNGDDKKNERCVENLIENRRMKNIDDVLNIIQKVKSELPSEKIRDISLEYDHLFDFYSVLVKHPELAPKLLHKFDEEEKKFIETYVSKQNYYLFHITDINALVDLGAFMKDSEIFQRVLQKVENIEKKVHES